MTNGPAGLTDDGLVTPLNFMFRDVLDGILTISLMVNRLLVMLHMAVVLVLLIVAKTQDFLA